MVVTKKDQTLVSGLLQRKTKTDTAVLVRDPLGTVGSIPSGEIAIENGSITKHNSHIRYT